MKKYAGYFVTAFLGALIASGVMELRYEQKTDVIQNVPDSSHIYQTAYTGSPAYIQPDLTTAAEKAVNSVVHVKVMAEGQDVYQIDPFQYFFFGQPNARHYKLPPRVGAGSGVIIASDGYIVTNNHVIDGADKIEVVLNNNKTYDAVVIGKDPSTDLALIKIEEKDLPALGFANSDSVRLGEWVLAVGNPLNLNSTVTAGIISAKARSINLLHTNPGENPPLEAYIQTDAAVNPGNSGGALVNVSGDLIGINSAIKSPTGSFTGYSFAIPSNIVRKVVNDLMEYGVVQRGYIGVSIRDIDAALVKEHDLKVSSGAYIAGVLQDGAADEAGLKEGDVIVRVGNARVDNVAALQEQIGRYKPGDEVMVTIDRDGEQKTYTVKLRNLKGEVALMEKPSTDMALILGAEFEDIANDEAKKLGIRGGVKITGLNGGKLRKAGIREGFIITDVDNAPVHNFEELRKALEGKKGGVLIGGVYPNGVRKYYGIGL